MEINKNISLSFSLPKLLKSVFILFYLLLALLLLIIVAVSARENVNYSLFETCLANLIVVLIVGLFERFVWITFLSKFPLFLEQNGLNVILTYPLLCKRNYKAIIKEQGENYILLVGEKEKLKLYKQLYTNSLNRTHSERRIV